MVAGMNEEQTRRRSTFRIFNARVHTDQHISVLQRSFGVQVTRSVHECTCRQQEISHRVEPLSPETHHFALQ